MLDESEQDSTHLYQFNSPQPKVQATSDDLIVPLQEYYLKKRLNEEHKPSPNLMKQKSKAKFKRKKLN